MPPLSKSHALVFPWPGQGHINPMMHLSKALLATGFSVTFVNTDYNHLRMMRSISSDVASGGKLKDGGEHIRFVSIPDGLPPDLNRVASVADVCLAVTKMEYVFEELLQKLMDDREEPPITCIISDIFVLCTQDVANRFRIPRVAFWTQSAVTFAAHAMASRGYRPPLEATNDSNYRIKCIPGAPPLRFTDTNTFLRPYDPSDFMYRFVTDPFHRLGEAACIVMNTVDELESMALDALRKEHKLFSMGSMLRPSFFRSSLGVEDTSNLWPIDHECLQWLDGHSPFSVLYVSFGSLAVLSATDIKEFALGLEASEQPFLWVVRPDLMGAVSVIFPEGFRERVGSRAFFVSWAPQLQVLNHPSIGAFLTHYGWNSILESIAAGVPMIGVPFFADQPTNCRCVVDGWKIGLSLEASKEACVSRADVEVKVRTLMEGEEGKEMRHRAARLKDAAGEALWEPGSWTNKNFEVFVEEIEKLSLKAEL